jgi:adenine/guanine phosphoribosyltransferase-like PRPP-binding protein
VLGLDLAGAQVILKTSPHLERGFHSEMRFEVIHDASKRLCEVDFDTIVVMGISGLVMGSVLAYQMNKKLAVVRKRGERELTTSGFSSVVEGYLGGKFIFFDDLISSG